MKQFLVALVVAFTFCSLAFANDESTTLRDSVKIEKKVAFKKKIATVEQASATEDTVSTYSDDVDSATIDAADNDDDSYNSNYDSNDFPFHGNFDHAIGSGVLISIVGITAVFGLPVLVIFFAFYFKYKNRRAKYRLAEQALAAGQPIPDELLKDVKMVEPTSQGIRNTFTGIGLFIFLWAITDEFGIGCIGLLVMFMGLGQWLVAINKSKEKEALNKASEETYKQRYEEEVRRRIEEENKRSENKCHTDEE